MDIRTISCVVAVIVFLVVPVTKGQASSIKPNSTTVTTQPLPGGNTTVNGTGGNGTATGGKNNTIAAAATTTQLTVGGGTVNGGTGAGVSGTGSGTGTGNATPKPLQCLTGNCTAKSDDQSCLKDLSNKCTVPSNGSCTKAVTKNTTHTVVIVGCAKTACPTNPASTTTTVKPSTPAPSKTTSTCCDTDLCNKYQAPQSAAFGLRTDMFYVIGLLIVKVCM